MSSNLTASAIPFIPSLRHLVLSSELLPLKKMVRVNKPETDIADLIERLKYLEFAIRKSMAVREDQDEPAERSHVAEAAQCGIKMTGDVTKGELLSAVQTLVRTTRAKEGSRTTPKK